MTTIIAVENSDHVLFASDSQATAGMQKTSLTNGKIFTNGDYTFGVAGLFSFLQALEHMELPAPTSSSLYSHLVTQVVPAIVEATKDKTVNYHGQQATIFEVSTAIVAVKGSVFQISGDGSVISHGDGLYAVGSGSDYALGSLSNVVGEPTKDDVLRALNVAARHDIGTGGPFWVRRV